MSIIIKAIYTKLDVKLLIVTETYPDKNNKYAQTYVHTRLLSYLEQNIEIEVISFQCKEKYKFEGVSVSPSSSFKTLMKTYGFDAIICHAPNLRHHMKLLLANFRIIPHVFFIFHGHEILIKNKYYPCPYKFQMSNISRIKQHIEKTYDYFKCFIIKHIINIWGGEKISLVFVSNYLKELFLLNVGLKAEQIAIFSTVIYNGLSEAFINKHYDFKSDKKLDFITIRPFDKSVYALDIVIKIANQNPDFSFHIFGEGNFFNYVSPPPNVKVFNEFLTPLQIAKKLNNYKAALMPSFHDTQGVMVCEMAAFGIPVVASKIPATIEMLQGVKNKLLLDNNSPFLDAKKFLEQKMNEDENVLKNDLSQTNTSFKEIEFIKNELKKHFS